MSESNWNKKEGSFPETTKIFTPNLPESVDRIIIHKDLSLPIIRAVQSQNIALKSQLQKVEEEVVNLEGMTKHLEQENQNLRSHYFQRNRDVQNIIQSIKINLGVQTSDINHHTHLLREGNCLLFKNIQGQLKKERQYNQRIQQLTKKLAQLKQSNVKLQQNVLFPLRVRLGNKLNKKKLQQLTQERDKKTKTEEELAKQINRLLMDVNSLQKENLKGLRQEREEKSNISKQKQSFKGNIINALKSLQELKSDIELQTNTLKQHTQYRDELMSKSKKVQQQAIRRNIEMEKKMSQLNKVLSKRQNQMKFYDQTRKATSQLELQLMKKREQKQKLKTALIAKQMDIEKQQAQHQGIKQKVQEETNISIFKLRVRIQTAEIEAKKEEKQLQRLYELEQENIESLKEELMELKKDLQYYQSVLRRVENPAKQLQREQVKQRLNQTRRPLFEKQR